MLDGSKITEEGLSKLHEVLFSKEIQDGFEFIEMKRLKNPQSENYKATYEYDLYSIPIATKDASETLSINSRIFEICLFHSGIELDHEGIAYIHNHLDNLSREDSMYDLSDMIHDKFHNLIYQYERVFNNTKTEACFVMVNDEEVILKNLIKHYREIQSNKSLQLQFLTGVNLPKKVNDIIIDIYIKFFRFRLSILNPTNDDVITSTSTSTSPDHLLHRKLTWKGNQQQLAELIIQLQKNDWVEEINKSDFKKVTRNIVRLFDISHTKRTESSNEVDSLNQLIKGELSKNNNREREYFFEENSSYVQAFDKIKLNE